MSSGEADAYYNRNKWLVCGHRETRDHFDNPSRFTCKKCGEKFVDYGNGYELDKFRGLAAEEVPKTVQK